VAVLRAQIALIPNSSGSYTFRKYGAPGGIVCINRSRNRSTHVHNRRGGAQLGLIWPPGSEPDHAVPAPDGPIRSREALKAKGRCA
jgi:hypothetical protein